LTIAVVIASCSTGPSGPEQCKNDYDSLIAAYDTAYVDPVSGYVKPPCSVLPYEYYCNCMKNRGITPCDCE